MSLVTFGNVGTDLNLLLRLIYIVTDNYYYSRLNVILVHGFCWFEYILLLPKI